MKEKELLSLLKNLAYSKEIKLELLIEILENSMSKAARKDLKDESLRVRFDCKKGSFTLLKRWKIVGDDQGVEDSSQSMHLSTALGRFNLSALVESVYDELIEYNLSRIAVNVIKSEALCIINKLHSENIVDRIKNDNNFTLKACVKFNMHRKILVNLVDYNIDCVIPFKNLLKKDRFHVGDIIECVMIGHHIERNGSLQIHLDRCSNLMLERLFYKSVPELQNKSVEVVKIVREPSVRSKLAIRSSDKGVDAIGACIGFRGKRVQDVSSQLSNEKIDVILYDADTIKFLHNAFKGLNIIDIIQTDDMLEVRVPSDQLPVFIGIGGSNARLTSALVGQNIKIVAI